MLRRVYVEKGVCEKGVCRSGYHLEIIIRRSRSSRVRIPDQADFFLVISLKDNSSPANRRSKV